jgi:GNAT superfamily N-acetyltransferase
MPSEIEIAEARTPEDIEAVRRLFLDYAAELGWDLSQGGWFAEEIECLPATYAPPHGSLMLARVGGRPAGALGLQPVPHASRIPGTGAETAGELKRLFVTPESRRHGVGRALMDYAEREARRLGYDALVLTTSAEMMPLAQGLYESMGYAETRPYRDDMPYPQIRWMRKEL